MYATVFDGVIFIEGSYPDSKKLQRIETSIKSFSAQLKSLKDVKAKMVVVAKETGANAIINFEYGQKSSFWSSGGDSVYWYGKGVGVLLSKQQYQEIIDSLI